MSSVSTAPSTFWGRDSYLRVMYVDKNIFSHFISRYLPVVGLAIKMAHLIKRETPFYTAPFLKTQSL